MVIRFVRRTVAILSASGLAAAGAMGPAAAAAGSGWQVVATIAPHNEEVQLNAVTATSPTDAWAVGVTGTGTGNIIEHWNGTSWRQVPVPAHLLARMQELGAVAATSDRNMWAIDLRGDWLHLDGTSWTTGRVPTLPGDRSGLTIGAALTAGRRSVWVFGRDSTRGQNLSYAARFNGTTWQATSLPGPHGAVGIVDASAASAQDIWAVAEGGPGLPTANDLVHWNGRRWRAVSLPSSLARQSQLVSVLAQPGGDVWVAGGIPHGYHHARGIIARWNGRTWTTDKLPAAPGTADDVITELVPDGSGGVWAMGFNRQPCAGPMWHYQAGAWTDTGLVGCSVGAYVHGPQGLANVPGTTSVWAVGGLSDSAVPNGEAGMVMLYGPQP
jgi:hypothetical protein